MTNVSPDEIYKARIKLLSARVDDLESENKRYLELLGERDKKIRLMMCCANCAKFYDKTVKDCKCHNFDKWELVKDE